jgi:DNA-binding transcriptional MocR family regulator
LHAALAAATAELPRHLPGPGYDAAGLPVLRDAIAAHLTARGVPTTAEQVLITGGALQGCALALSVLAGAGDRVLVEHPTYPHVADAIVAQGSLLVPVPVDAADPDAVVADLTRVARQTGPRAAYLMPDFQNPTGLLLDADQRSRLASGLQQHGVTAVVDETLAELGLDRQPPAPFAAFAAPGTVVTAGSASKAFWGGLRIGWLRAEAPLVDALAAALGRSQMGTPVLEQLAVCHLLEEADEVLLPLRARLRDQRAVLLEELAHRLPDWQVRVPEGGLVLWCRLPAPSSSALVSAAGERGLRLAAGSRFGSGHAFEQWLRLPYTQPVEVLRRAVPILAAAAQDLEGPGPRRHHPVDGAVLV